MKKLKKGEWYEFKGHKECLLQYNDGKRTKGWWNGDYGTNWCFKGLADIAKPASEKMLKKYGVIKEMKEMKEKKKLNFNWIYLLGGVVSFIMSVVALIKGDIAIVNTNLILAILLFNWYKDSVREVNTTYNLASRMDGKDLVLTIERDKVRKN